jgi:hypothetical protein
LNIIICTQRLADNNQCHKSSLKFEQVIFCGGSPNSTLDHIIKESPLIEVYRSCHVKMENAFHFQHHTIHHTPPDMAKTIQKLTARIKQENSHTKKEGQSALHSIPDQIAVGMVLIQEQKIVSEEDTRASKPEADDFID